MGSPVVSIPGVGNVQFPSSMSQDDINQAASRLYHQQAAQSLAANPPGVPRPQVKMQQSVLGSTDYSDPSLPQFGGMHGGSYDIAFRDPQGQISPQTINAEALGGSAGVAAGFAPKAAPAVGSGLSFLYNQAQKHPLISYYAINQARQIPGIGKHIPALAEALPFLLPKGQTEGDPLIERDATRQNAPFAGEAEEEPSLVERDATRTNLPYAGEEELSAEEAAEQARQSAMPRPLRPTVGSPEDWQQYDDKMARLKQEASDAGTYSAARGKTTRKLNYQQRVERSY